jgi:glycosyltransferase involved in cell wall biosynthesis
LATISTCDIVVGKILPSIGWIGKFDLEAMALGKPVIGFVSDELYEKYKPPLYRTTKESFWADLEALLEDKNERDRLAVEGPAHIQENYNVQDIVKTLQTYYDNIG